MIPVAVDRIDHQTLLDLVGTPESKTLEFKGELPPKNDGARVLARGVSALANTLGGDFVIGVTEKDGLVHEAPGVAEDVDKYRGQIVQVIRSQIDPPPPRFDVRPVACPDGRWAFVVRVGRSWTGPHRTVFDREFNLRTAHGVEQMTVPELRAAFGEREGVVDRIERFRTDRLTRVMAGATPMRLASPTCIVLHLVSMPAIAERRQIDVWAETRDNSHMVLPLRGPHTSAGLQFNMHGLMNFAGDTLGQGADSYGLLFRSGAVEGVDCTSQDKNGPFVESLALANRIVAATRNYLGLQASLGVETPTAAMLSFCNARGLRMVVQRPSMPVFMSLPLTEDLVALPEVVFETADADAPTTLRPLLNVVWQAFGLQECDLFDRDGAWLGRG